MSSVQLKHVASWVSGVSFSPSEKVEPYSGDSIVCFTTRNIQEELDESQLVAIPIDHVKRKEQYVQHEDILVSSANSWNLVGKCCWVPRLGYKATLGAFISLLRPNRSIVHPRYLYYWMSSPETQLRLRKLGRQTTNISNLDKNRALNLNIALPPLPEQQRIAAILDKADRLRRLRRYALELGDSFLQSVFLEMFGDPVTNPMGWEMMLFSRICTIDSEMVDPRKNIYKHLPHIGGANIESVSGRLVNMQTAEQEGLISGKFLVTPEHILFSKIRPKLRKVALPRIHCLCSADIYPIRIKSANCHPLYLLYWLRSPQFTSIVAERAEARAQIPKVNREELSRIAIPLPNINIQENFSKVVQHFDRLQAKQQEACNQADHLFWSLLARSFGREV